jgi:hypothetical protein
MGCPHLGMPDINSNGSESVLLATGIPQCILDWTIFQTRRTNTIEPFLIISVVCVSSWDLVTPCSPYIGSSSQQHQLVADTNIGHKTPLFGPCFRQPPPPNHFDTKTWDKCVREKNLNRTRQGPLKIFKMEEEEPIIVVVVVVEDSTMKIHRRRRNRFPPLKPRIL